MGLPLTLLLAVVAAVVFDDGLGSVDFRAHIEQPSMVSIEDLGHGVFEAIATAPGVAERRIIATAPDRFRLSPDGFDLYPSGVAVAFK